MQPRWVLGISVLFVAGLSGAEPSGPRPDTAILAGKILPVDAPVIDGGVILIGGGRILALGSRDSVAIPDGVGTIDARGHWVMPGIVEAHTHLACAGGFNDMVYPLNPDLGLGDCVDWESPHMDLCVAEGVTTMNVLPGSGTNNAGWTVIVKTAGASPRERLVRDPGCLKIAQSHNPERRGGDMGATRMGMAYLLRRLMHEGREYTEAWRAYERKERPEPPPVRRDLERVRLVFEGEVPVISHTATGWGLAQTVRQFHDEFGLELAATHTSFGGFQAGAYAAQRATRVHINIGPRLMDWETSIPDGRLRAMAAEHWRRGVRNLSINTDAVGFYSARISPGQHLFFQASMAAQYGLDEQAAIRAITLEPARAIKIDARVGSITPGKDADLILKRGSLVDVTIPVDMVLVDGRVAHAREGHGIAVTPAARRAGS